MHFLSVKKICSCYVHLLNDWNYFWNKYCNLLFLAICHSLLSPFDISCFILISKSKNWTGNEPAIQKNDYHIKGLYETTCYKTKSNFSQFFFCCWLLHKCFLSFLIKVFANFEKLIRFHWQAFIVYKNGESLKRLIILAVLDHLKPKIFFAGQRWWST